MTDNDINTIDPFAQPFAFDGIPMARPLTRDDLGTIQDALRDFKAALAAWDGRREAGRREDGAKRGREREAGPGTAGKPAAGNAPPAEGRKPQEDGSAAQPGSGSGNGGPTGQLTPDDFHCLILTGYLGKGYEPPSRSHGPQSDRCTEEAVAQVCSEHFGVDKRSSAPGGYLDQPCVGKIHVILESSGGSLDSAYKVVLFLRRFAEEVRVYVPGRAKSAATLIAVGADLVVMSPFGELGPLDTQITDPRNPARHVSALDCYRSVDYVREFGAQAIPRALKVMLDQTQALIPLAELLNSATRFAVGSVTPMLEQVKSLDFGAWGRTLSIGETYARALRRRLRHPDTEESARRIATKLVYGYPHHPYPIDKVEAKNLGMAVEMMPSDVYMAAEAIAAACWGEARLVGFSEDVERAIAQAAELEDGAPGSSHVPTPRVAADGSPRAFGPVGEDPAPAFGPVGEDPAPELPAGPVNPDLR